MDKVQKMKVAKALVTVDDAIANSKGISDLLGKVLTAFVGSFFGADLPTEKEDVSTEGK